MSEDKWKADYWFKRKLTEADFKGKTKEKIDEIYEKALTDFKLYQKKRLKKSQDDKFGIKFVENHAETEKRKKKYDKEHLDEYELIHSNYTIARKKAGKDMFPEYPDKY